VIGSRNVPPLVGGASSAGTVTVVIPQGTATGTWYILAKADADGAVVEIYENNNVSYARSVQIGSDLSLSALSAPAAAGAGQNISVSDTTRNLGGGTAEASVTKYYLSSNSTIDDADILLGSRSLPALAAGAADSGGMTVMIPAGTAGGTWFIIAKADADGAVTETSDSNNIYWRSIFISAGVGPH
jgi:subtilase family serine protease